MLIYALRNALVPVVTVAGMSFGYMFGWALIIESVFNISGLSRALLTAIQQRDFVLGAGGGHGVHLHLHPGEPGRRY